MDLLLKICLYSVLGLALFAANVVFARSVYRTFVHRGSVKSIAPFEVVGLGKDHDAAAHGSAMARMLRARLMRIKDEMASLQALGAASGRAGETDVTPQVQPAVSSLDLPERIFAPIDLQLEIAGVQVGGLLARLQAAAAERDTLRFVVRYHEKAVTIAGDDGTSEFSLWLDEAPRTDSQIVEEIAYALVHRQVGMRVPEVNALDGDEFQSLLKTLYQLSQLNQRIARGRLVAAEPFENVLPALDRLVERAPRWRELVRVTAQTAELAGRAERALELYQRELDISPQATFPRQKVADLQARLNTRYAGSPGSSATAARTPGAASKPEDRIRELLGVRLAAMSRPVTIGVVGGPPLPGVNTTGVRTLGSPTTGNQELAEYVTTLLQAARIVAPDATYLFAPVARMDQAALADALDQLRATGAEVILFAYGAPTTSAILRDAFRNVAESGIVAIVPAGNDPTREATARQVSPDRALIVGAVDLAGRRAKFSNNGNTWAPGVEIPMSPPVTGPARDGTAYSATLAAALAARLLAEQRLPPADLVRRLRETSVKIAGGEPIMNLENALKRGT